MREDTKTLVFAAIVCVSCSLLLSGTAAALKDRQDANKDFDVKRNIVKAFGQDIKGATRESVDQVFEDHINEMVVDAQTGEIIEDMKPSDISSEDRDAKTKLPLYTWTEDGDLIKYAFPISGKGLWSMLFGYISLESDMETIAGITFYKHGETPGLGAEIEKSWFQNQFVGKNLYDSGIATEFMVAKPGSAQGDHAVDGISGATLTGNGVQQLLRRDAKLYEEYFNKVREN